MKFCIRLVALTLVLSTLVVSTTGCCCTGLLATLATLTKTEQISNEVTPLIPSVSSKPRLVLPYLPCNVDDYLSGTLEDTCQITSIEYELEENYDGTYSATLYIDGTKTYGYWDDSFRDAIEINWKVYDSNGYTYDSGYFYTSSLYSGENFYDQVVYLNYLEAGETYTFELFNG